MASFSNFTAGDDDPTHPHGAGGPPPTPPMGGAAQQVDDVTEIMINYNERFMGCDPAMFRDDLIHLTMSVLISKSKPNPLLVGSAGVGKTRIVEEIARLIAEGSSLVPDALKQMTVWELPLSSLVAGAGIVGELESRVASVVDYASDPKNKAVLFIDEIHLLQSNDTTYRKVAQMLKPALARGNMHLVGATTSQEARKLDDDPAFARRFSRIVVDELTRDQTVEVLRHVAMSMTQHYGHKVSISDETLAEVAQIADEKSPASSHRPDSALTLLDRAMGDTVVAHCALIAQAEDSGDQTYAASLRAMTPIALTKEKVLSVAVRLMTGIPTKKAFDEVELRSALSKIKGQDDALGELVAAMRRDALGVFPRTRPQAWMFAGPSGVGKTEATKVIAEALTGQPPIMLNMGEYAHNHDISRLIGSGPGYVGSESDKELPFDTLESNPYRVILFDEIEKADKSIHRLLLTALDEGWMRMASGKIVDFSKAFVIATTNAGREAFSRAQPIGFAIDNDARSLTRQEIVKALEKFFEAEFLGRFSQLLAFKPLDRAVYAEILESAYTRERERIVTSHPRQGTLIPASLSDDELATSVARTYQPTQGARPAEREAQRLIEDALMSAQQSAATVPATLAPAGDENSDAEPIQG